MFVFILGLPGAEGDVKGEVVVKKAVGSVGCGAHSPALLFPLLAPQEPSSLGPAAHESEATAGGI